MRRLKVFAFDPSRGRALGNHLTLEVPWEQLAPGPRGKRVHVIEGHAPRHPGDPDFSPPRRQSARPRFSRADEVVDLDDPVIRRHDGLDPTELDPRFHQQMTYAVVSHQIDLFERALGRRISWRWSPRSGPEAPLRVYLHAMEEPNAYFEPERGELSFGYFKAAHDAIGSTLPGQTIYTCLSYDVIAHETMHALVDSIIPQSKDSDMEGMAFLEGFCDLMTLLQHFEFTNAVHETVRRTRGRIHDPSFAPDIAPVGGEARVRSEAHTDNPLLQVATQFGEAITTKALREVLVSRPDPKAIHSVTEPHERGAFLAAAVLDAFVTVYNRRTEDVVRLARGMRPDLPLHPDLTQRLTREATKVAGQFLGMCIRALDYCPPINIRFGDFLRALITADQELVPDDKWGHRSALIDAFRWRGIRPDGVASYAEDALRLAGPASRRAQPLACEGLVLEGDPDHVRSSNDRRIGAFVKRHARELGLGRGPLKLDAMARRSQKTGPSGQVLREFAIEIMEAVRADRSREDDGTQRHGIRLILDAEGSVRFVIGAGSRRARSAPPGTRKACVDDVLERVLRVYAFDPTQGRSFGNHLSLHVRREPLLPGPVGAQVAVIDFDPGNGAYYVPLDLNDPALVPTNGVPPSELDPRFHQQMVYAVAMETIRRFEHALGRPVRWRWTRKDGDPVRNALRIFPHALQDANAYYDRELGALLFGYFRASESDAGTNLPGQTVFTCLSHDIVVHETTHAVLDTVQPHFLEATSLDAIAFHEAFGDIVALFQHFSFKEALLETIQRTGGRIHASRFRPELEPGGAEGSLQVELSPDNPMVDLARQFGEAMGTRTALRAALGTKPGSRRLEDTEEPHDRGSILVAAIFDAFFSVYIRRSRDLMRLARAGGAPMDAGDVHPDLAARLAREASKCARHFATICIRALDYCPPVDIRFGDYLRAIVTADADLVPDDPWGYRAAIVGAFASRGIWPQGVASLSEEALRWDAVDDAAVRFRCPGLQLDALDQKSRKVNAILLHRFAVENRVALGLGDGPVQVNRFHSSASQRVDPSGRTRREYVVHLLQQREERILPDDPATAFTFRGGTTMILDEHGEVQYLIGKSIGSERRLRDQRDHLDSVAVGSAAACLCGPSYVDASRVSLAAVHGGW